MADVYDARLLRLFGLIVLAKTVDFAARGAALWLVAAWLAAGAFVYLGYRWALPAVTVLTAVAFAAGFQNQHMWLLLWLPVTFLVGSEDRRWLWRWQTTILYGYAVVAKITPDYLSGRRIEAALGDIPAFVVVALALGGLAAEAFLAFGLWRWPWAKWVGVAFHVSVVATMTTGPVHTLRLAVFGALVLLMYEGFTPARPAMGEHQPSSPGRHDCSPARPTSPVSATRR